MVSAILFVYTLVLLLPTCRNAKFDFKIYVRLLSLICRYEGDLLFGDGTETLLSKIKIANCDES